MLTTGARLKQIAGACNLPAWQLLRQAAGNAGASTCSALAAYSGLPAAPAWVHLMHEGAIEPPPGGWGGFYRKPARRRRARYQRDEILLWGRA